MPAISDETRTEEASMENVNESLRKTNGLVNAMRIARSTAGLPSIKDRTFVGVDHLQK
jgi:hypothetical protein